MPTQLLRTNDTRRLRANQKLDAIARPQIVEVRGLFEGYVPDVDPQLLGYQHGREVTGCVGRGGALTHDDGYERIDSANLALTGSGVIDEITAAAAAVVRTTANHGLTTGQTITIAGTDSTPVIDGARVVTVTDNTHFTVPVDTTGGAGTTGTWTIAGGGVIGLHQYTDSSGAIHRLVVCTNRLFTLTAGAWVQVPFDGTAGKALSTTVGQLSVAAYDTLNNVLYFTNDDDEVFEFDGSSYHEFDPGAGVPTTLGARSVETFDDKAFFLNTVEGGTEQPFRLRWTRVGPWNVGGGDDPFTDTGGSFRDFTDLQSEGLRNLVLGPSMACYFRRGVALVRPTLTTTLPPDVEIISAKRGLLGPHSVVNIGSGTHFGIFTDGWFFLNANGVWTEAGIMRTGDRLEHKWWKTFTELLNWEQRDRVVIDYDTSNQFVRIAFPSTGQTNPDIVWTYDIRNDRVWPDSYVGGVNAWSVWDDEVATGETYATSDPTTYEEETRTYAEVAAHTGQQRLLHGTTTDLVFRHTPTVVTRDGALPAFSWQSWPLDLGVQSAIKVADKVWVSYERQDDPVAAMNVRVDNGRGRSFTRTVTMALGLPGTLEQEYQTYHLPGTRLGLTLSGSAPFRVNGLQLNYLVEGTERVRP